ncbi:MAG: type II-A CRISPR-associated protein Csn2 [Anaerolineaceae bacterium]|jgi:CRISPR-associated protein Csn2
MKLVHHLIENELLKEDQTAGVLVVEKTGFLPQLVRQLAEQLDGLDGSYVLSEQFRELALPKFLSLNYSVLNLEHNPRRALNALYKQLLKHIAEVELSYELQDLFNQLSQKLNQILNEAGVELAELQHPEWDSILKFYDVRFKAQFDSLEEEVCDYCRMLNHYLGLRVFVFVHCLAFFSIETLELLRKQMAYDGLQILFMESNLPEGVCPEGYGVLIIDQDLCEITKNPV